MNWNNLSLQQKQDLMQSNNPNGLPIGLQFGRCQQCQSTNLWNDVTVYGCNCCGAIYNVGA